MLMREISILPALGLKIFLGGDHLSGLRTCRWLTQRPAWALEG